MNEERIRAAHDFAAARHAGQTDKSGMPYITHPERVAARVEGELEKITAYLHDTVEDTGTTLEEIEALFGYEVRDAVDCLTHRPGESYEAYAARAKANPIARAVKISDLTDNSNLTRLHTLTLKDALRQLKYARTLVFLLDD